jgi:hypothetical protein
VSYPPNGPDDLGRGHDAARGPAEPVGPGAAGFRAAYSPVGAALAVIGDSTLALPDNAADRPRLE